jgi:hypothetical protein
MRRLFPADQEKEPGEAVLRGGYPLVSQYRADIPLALDDIVMRALSTDPAARFRSMRELAEAVEAASPARANARRIGEWVLDLARDALADRTRKVARVENWIADEIPLKSTPFTAELPLRPHSASTRPPEVFEANVPPLLLQAAPPLPASVSSALAARSSPPPPTPAIPKPSAASTSGSRWWLWLFLLVGVAAYLALRTR